MPCHSGKVSLEGWEGVQAGMGRRGNELVIIKYAKMNLQSRAVTRTGTLENLSCCTTKFTLKCILN